MVKKINQKGFTILEVVVSVAIFAVLGATVFQMYAFIINQIRSYRDQTVMVALADQYIEVARNLPYADVATVGNQAICERFVESGDPCSLPDLASPENVSVGGVNYQVYYAISYVDDPTDGLAGAGDVEFNDYKQVKLYVKNIATDITKSFVTSVSPKGLESLGSRGALYIRVIDYVGQPIQGASIHIVNTGIVPAVDVTRTSGADGTWFEVLFPDVNGYQVTVTKEGYSTDRTYPVTVENPNPIKPYATVEAGKVSPVLSFSIDELSSLTFYAKSQTCQAVAGVDLAIRGGKLIGTNPDVYKFEDIYTSNASGIIYPASDPCYNGKCLEWDNYTPGISSDTYMIYGTSPPQETNILPGTDQEFTLILGQKSTNSLLVVVKDSSLGTPIEGASVTLSGPVNAGPLETGGSVWTQQDWSSPSDSYNISTAETPYALRLSKFGNDYVSSGWLESSTFDTGTSQTAYTTLNWLPTSQTLGAEIKFQIATNNDEETWNFVGPDGTAGTYYDTPGTTIHSSHNGQQYVRYKAFLSTTNPAVTPTLSSVGINYVSGCPTPGQVIFTDLIENQSGAYTVTVSKTGYEEQTIGDLSISGYNLLEVELDSN